jgi:hypothetical protein
LLPDVGFQLEELWVEKLLRALSGVASAQRFEDGRRSDLKDLGGVKRWALSGSCEPVGRGK